MLKHLRNMSSTKKIKYNIENIEKIIVILQTKYMNAILVPGLKFIPDVYSKKQLIAKIIEYKNEFQLSHPLGYITMISGIPIYSIMVSIFREELFDYNDAKKILGENIDDVQIVYNISDYINKGQISELIQLNNHKIVFPGEHISVFNNILQYLNTKSPV